MGNCYVYGLFRPDTAQIFYIGMGRARRAWDHVRHRERGRSLKDNIICELLDDRKFAEIPIVILRANLSRDEAAALEIALIYALGRHPHGPLVNVLKGGEGFNKDYRVIHRLDLEMRRRARMADPDVRAKMSESAKARVRTPEFEAKRLAAAHSPEVRAKRGISQAKRGWITNGIEEIRAFKVDPIPTGWRRGRLNLSESAKENMRNAVRPPLTQEHRQKLSAVAKGKPTPWFQRPEVRARAERNRRGRIWITNGVKSCTIMPTAAIPDGWHRGRSLLTSEE